jgi:hypothetical protein
MRTFTLLLENDGNEARRIEFLGYEASEAFTLLQHEKATRKATLWESDKRLGIIVRNDADFWEISN